MPLVASFAPPTDDALERAVLRVLYVCDEPLPLGEIAAFVGTDDGTGAGGRGSLRLARAQGQHDVRRVLRALHTRGWVRREADHYTLSATGLSAAGSAAHQGLAASSGGSRG